MRSDMRIGAAAAAAGTPPRARRCYEERGLLPPPRRTATGQRQYGPGDVARVRTIRELLALGLTVEDLRSIADRISVLVEDPPPRCGQPDSDVPGSGVVDRRLAALDAEINRLTQLRTRLALRTNRPRAGTPVQEVVADPALQADQPRLADVEGGVPARPLHDADVDHG